MNEKHNWQGTLLAIQPRIRLMRSFDQRSHSYLGYALRIQGTIGDEAVANTLTIDVTALTSSFTSQSAAFITPTNIPDIVYLLVEVSTAITNTENVWIDELSLKAMDTYYLDGVVGALFTGVTPWVAED
jgi:hypothetical protein